MCDTPEAADNRRYILLGLFFIVLSWTIPLGIWKAVELIIALISHLRSH